MYFSWHDLQISVQNSGASNTRFCGNSQHPVSFGVSYHYKHCGDEMLWKLDSWCSSWISHLGDFLPGVLLSRCAYLYWPDSSWAIQKWCPYLLSTLYKLADDAPALQFAVGVQFPRSGSKLKPCLPFSRCWMLFFSATSWKNHTRIILFKNPGF